MLFTDPDPAPVRVVLALVTADKAFAAGLAARAIEAGKRYFELSEARDQFCGPSHAARARSDRDSRPDRLSYSIKL